MVCCLVKLSRLSHWGTLARKGFLNKIMRCCLQNIIGIGKKVKKINIKFSRVRYSMAQYDMVLHSTLQWLQQNIHQRFKSKNFCENFEKKNWVHQTSLHCITLERIRTTSMGNVNAYYLNYNNASCAEDKEKQEYYSLCIIIILLKYFLYTKIQIQYRFKKISNNI